MSSSDNAGLINHPILLYKFPKDGRHFQAFHFSETEGADRTSNRGDLIHKTNNVMDQLKNMAILLIVAAVLQSSEAADYTVGGSTGWISSPPRGASFYSSWASNITFKENDTLVFNFVTGSHSVAELTKANFDSCNLNNNIQVFATSPVRFTLNRTGEFYFACSFRGHCNSGQKLSVKVTGSSPAPAQGPSPPAPGTTPSPPSNTGASPPPSSTEPGATAPPPQGSAATTLAATSSLLLITVVTYLLF